MACPYCYNPHIVRDNGNISLDEALEFLQKGDKTVEKQQEMEHKALFATRQLAKRQYTWLRSLQEVHKFTTYSTITQAQEDLRNCYG